MIFRKINRFSGEYYQWDSLESRSENCKFNFLNGKLMNKEEKEDFQFSISIQDEIYILNKTIIIFKGNLSELYSFINGFYYSYQTYRFEKN